jgi:hypothetical protein
VSYANPPLTYTQVSPANAVDPHFATHAQTAHKLPPPSHRQSQTLHEHASNSQRLPPFPANVTWHAARHEQYSGHTSDPLVPGATTSGQTKSSNASWSVVETCDVGGASSVYERGPAAAQPWALVQAQQQNHAASVDGHTHMGQSTYSSAHTPGARRQLTKKKAAKVPSSFVERQEKLKVSKRKGPLHEKQREKTHTMRKTKRICVRCRFYKSGVCVRMDYRLIELTFAVR